MLRRIIATVVGIVISFTCLLLFEQILCYLFPLPQNVDPKSPEAVHQILNNMPTASYVILLAIYAFSAFLGGIMTAFILAKRSIVPALIVGGLLTLSGVWDVIHTTNPWWFSIATLLVFIPFAYLGSKIVKED